MYLKSSCIQEDLWQHLHDATVSSDACIKCMSSFRMVNGGLSPYIMFSLFHFILSTRLALALVLHLLTRLQTCQKTLLKIYITGNKSAAELVLKLSPGFVRTCKSHGSTF